MKLLCERGSFDLLLKVHYLMCQKYSQRENQEEPTNIFAQNVTPFFSERRSTNGAQILVSHFVCEIKWQYFCRTPYAGVFLLGKKV
jgi:hypothetical protein